MKSLTTFFKRHLAAIILAFLVGGLMVTPHFLAVYDLGTDYKGIPFFYSDNEFYYQARIQEIIDGHPSASSPYYYEYKDVKNLVPPVGEYFYYIPHVLTGLSVSDVIVLSKFLFPAILFILIYFIVWNIGENLDKHVRLYSALAAGTLSTLGYFWVDYHQAFNLIMGAPETTLSLWVRPVNPITGGLILFGLLNLLWLLWRRNFKYIWVAIGVLLALSVGYFFSFGLALAIMTTLAVIAIVRKNYRLVFELIAAFILSALIDLPFWINAISAVGNGNSLALQNGMLLTHTPINNKTLLLAGGILLAVIIYMFWKKILPKGKDADWLWFAGAGVLGGFVALNEQVITGRTIWPYHFSQYTVLIAVITAVAALAWFFNQYPKIWRALSILLILFLLGYSVFTASTYKYTMTNFREIQRYVPLFDWLNKNTPLDSVVLVKEDREELDRMIPAFTHLNVYRTDDVAPAATIDRKYQSYMTLLRLRNVPAEGIENYLNEHETEVRGYLFTDWSQLFSTERDPRIDLYIKELASRYKKFAAGDFKKELEEYRLDYIVLEGKPTGALAGVLKGESPVKIGDFSVYQFR